MATQSSVPLPTDPRAVKLHPQGQPPPPVSKTRRAVRQIVSGGAAGK